MIIVDITQQEKMKAYWTQRKQLKEQIEQDRRQDALKKAAKIAKILKENYGALQVILFGSLAWGNHFHEKSDIDIFVIGFPKESDYWGALGESEHLADPFPLSIVLEENAVPSLIERVKKEGVVL